MHAGKAPLMSPPQATGRPGSAVQKLKDIRSERQPLSDSTAGFDSPHKAAVLAEASMGQRSWELPPCAPHLRCVLQHAAPGRH